MDASAGTTLVTGGSRRIGMALCLSLLDSGRGVVAHSRSWEPEKIDMFSEVSGTQAGVDWHPWAHDFTLPRPALPDVPVKHLVLNASLFERGADWKGLSSTQDEAERMARHLQVNVIAQWELAVALAARGDLESIVIVLDTYFDRPLPGYGAYQVSRAAGAGLVRALASELAPIRVNGVAPGTVLWSERPAAERAESDQGVRDRTVLGRTGKPQDVVGAVRYLLDAPYVTGEILRVDGGRWKA